MNSSVFFTPILGDVTSTKGCEAISPTGVKSCQLYLMVDETSLLMATSLLAPTNRV